MLSKVTCEPITWASGEKAALTSVVLDWSLRLGIRSKLPGDADPVHSSGMLEKPLEDSFPSWGPPPELQGWGPGWGEWIFSFLSWRPGAPCVLRPSILWGTWREQLVCRAPRALCWDCSRGCSPSALVLADLPQLLLQPCHPLPSSSPPPSSPLSPGLFSPRFYMY